MAEAQNDPNFIRKSREQIFYEVFHPKWLAAMQTYGLTVDRFSDRAVSLNLIGEKTIPNWYSGKTRSPLSGDYERAVGIVVKTFASFLKDQLNDLYVLVSHGWTREQFWEVVKGRTLPIKGRWVLLPIPSELEPDWEDYDKLIALLLNVSGPLNPSHLIGVIEASPGQVAHQLNALKNHSQVIDAFSLIYYQLASVPDMAWEEFGRDLKREAVKAVQEASRPVLIVLAGAEPIHIQRLRDFLKIIRGNEYTYLVSALDIEVLDGLRVQEQFRYDIRPTSTLDVEESDDHQATNLLPCRFPARELIGCATAIAWLL